VTIASHCPCWFIAAYLLVGAAIGRFSRFTTPRLTPENTGLRRWTVCGDCWRWACTFITRDSLTSFTQTAAGRRPRAGLSRLGPLSVALFFSLTAFLFWRKALAKGGRVDPVQLFMNRVAALPRCIRFTGSAGAVVLVLAKFPILTICNSWRQRLGACFHGFFWVSPGLHRWHAREQ